MSSYEQAKVILEKYGYQENKFQEFGKVYTFKRFWGYDKGPNIDGYEVTIALYENGEYDCEEISVLNNRFDYDDVEDMTDLLKDLGDEIYDIRDEIGNIELDGDEE